MVLVVKMNSLIIGFVIEYKLKAHFVAPNKKKRDKNLDGKKFP
jgi:hypothetical protein